MHSLIKCSAAIIALAAAFSQFSFPFVSQDPAVITAQAHQGRHHGEHHGYSEGYYSECGSCRNNCNNDPESNGYNCPYYMYHDHYECHVSNEGSCPYEYDCLGRHLNEDCQKKALL